MQQYLGRQPILSKDNTIYAYELLYRDQNLSSTFDDNRFATASVLVNTLNRFGYKSIVGPYRAFIKVDHSFILHDMVLSIPKDLFVLSILENSVVDERFVDRVQKLYLDGFVFALNDIALTKENLERFAPILEYLSFCKIDTMRIDGAFLEVGVAAIKAHPPQLIATKVETIERFDYFSDKGFEYFQGYYFAEPKIIEGVRLDADQFSVIRLCNLLMSNAGIDEITEAFEQNHAITVQLLQFINSGAFHFQRRIASVHHILTLVGRNPLAQWLMMMIYAKSVKSEKGEVPPLLLMVKNRTEIMMRVLKMVEPHVKSNLVGEAYFVGVLSLMETLTGVPLEKLLKELNVAEGVKLALLQKTGLLGEIYSLILSVEHFDTMAIDDFMIKHNLPVNAVEALLAETIENVNAFDEAMKSSGSLTP